ncbi:aldehyde dehydrogenase family protein [Saccharopolyspora spinosporotrichia]
MARKHSGDPGVLTQGPGRSKILITRDVDWQEHLDVIVDSIAAEAGTACVNATAVLVEGDPAPLAAAIASRLERLPSLPADHPDAVLPTMPSAQAEKLSSFLRTKTGSATAFLGSEGVADDLGDGSAALRPAVLQPRRGAFEQIGIELPFPCVWVASWSPDDGVGPLRDTLVLTALTRDDDLIESLVDEPTIANVYVGDRPTHWFGAGVPHDSFLADFLMRTKGMSRTW